MPKYRIHRGPIFKVATVVTETAQSVRSKVKNFLT